MRRRKIPINILFLFPATQHVRFEQFLFARGSDRRARVFYSEFRLPFFVLSGSFDKSMMFEQLKSELISSKVSKSLLEEWYGVKKSDFADLWTGGEGVFRYKIWEEETVEARAGIQMQQNTVICFFWLVLISGNVFKRAWLCFVGCYGLRKYAYIEIPQRYDENYKSAQQE